MLLNMCKALKVASKLCLHTVINLCILVHVTVEPVLSGHHWGLRRWPLTGWPLNAGPIQNYPMACLSLISINIDCLSLISILSVLAVHRPFYISICISTLPTQHTTFIKILNGILTILAEKSVSSDRARP